MTTAGTGTDFEIVHEFPRGPTEAGWRDLLRRIELPSHYTAPEFFLEPYWDEKRPFAVLSRQHGRVTGVATGIHEGDQLVSGLLSRPQICIDKSADPAATADQLSRGLMAEAGRAQLVTVYGWNWTRLDALMKHGFRRRQMEGDVILDLTLGPDALFRHFNATRRTDVRLAIKRGVEISRAATPEDFRAYYEVFKRWQNTPRKKIVMNIPYDIFERAAHLTSNRCIFLASYSGKVIAGISLRFFPGGLLEYAGNASMDEFLSLKPNDLLQWRAIEWACREGFQRYSLGGAELFHRRSGGEVVPINRFRLDRTWLRRHNLQETVRDVGRSYLRRLPQPVERIVRLGLGKR